MSYVTDVLIVFSFVEDEDDRIEEIDAYFKTNNPSAARAGVFKRVEEHAGGSKHMQQIVLAAAENYLDLAAFIGWLATRVKWEEPENVSVIVRDESWERARLVYVSDIKLNARGEARNFEDNFIDHSENDE